MRNDDPAAVVACKLAQTQQTAAVMEIYNEGMQAMLAIIENDQDGWLMKQANVVAQITRDIEALNEVACAICEKSQVQYQAAYVHMQEETAILKFHNPSEADS
jgi:hypothetical protein